MNNINYLVNTLVMVVTKVIQGSHTVNTLMMVVTKVIQGSHTVNTLMMVVTKVIQGSHSAVLLLERALESTCCKTRTRNNVNVIG